MIGFCASEPVRGDPRAIFTEPTEQDGECGSCFGLVERTLLANSVVLATPRRRAELLRTAAGHLACGLDSGRYFHGDITNCSLSR
jgi:hypothetical protein